MKLITSKDCLYIKFYLSNTLFIHLEDVFWKADHEIHSNMTFRICSPDNIFFTIHGLSLTRLSYCFAIVTMSIFAVVCYGLNTTTLMLSIPIWNVWLHSLLVSLIRSNVLAAALGYWSFFIPVVLYDDSFGHCLPFLNCLPQSMN